MCGIAGFVSLKPPASGEGLLRQMADAIRHRGPDDAGYRYDGLAGLAHRRLSIVDLSTAGHQPMPSEDQSKWIVFNGEIFNHADVRPELERAGHVYTSRTDTETIIHGFEQWGPAILDRFRGMFAFALWDTDRRRLFCARDRLGIKPFYYWTNGTLFAFASEIKALLQHPAISAEFEESVLSEYLTFGYVSDERTFFKGIRKLMPGHHLTLDASGSEFRIHIEKYWDVPVPTSETIQRPDEEWIAETRRRLEETVRLRLMADVPLGMFLSGGVDSSAIAALIKRMVSGPVKTFAVGYAEAAYSELGYAAHVAQAIGTEHHEIVVSMDEFFGALPHLIWHEDEPIVWPSSVALNFVSQLAAREVTVVLTGEGSDELFGGYGRYAQQLRNEKAAGYYNMVPGGLRSWIRNQTESSSLLSGDIRRKLQHTLLGRDTNIESLYLDNFYSAIDGPDLTGWLKVPGQDPYANFLRYWNAHPQASSLRRLLYADQKTYLVELLMKQDQMSMETSIESRVPFLDHQFVEFAMTVPDHLKIHEGEQKYILKKAVEDLLPHDIIYRKKMGFPTPVRDWFRNPSTEPLFAALRSPSGFLSSYIKLEPMNALLDRHRAGQADATDRIWRLLNLQIWADQFILGRREQWSEPGAWRELAHPAV